MTFPSKKRSPPGTSRLAQLKLELLGVDRFLHELAHNRGRWPRKWVKGMLRHYMDRRMSLRDQISRRQREQEG